MNTMNIGKLSQIGDIELPQHRKEREKEKIKLVYDKEAAFDYIMKGVKEKLNLK